MNLSSCGCRQISAYKALSRRTGSWWSRSDKTGPNARVSSVQWFSASAPATSTYRNSHPSESSGK
ncbi:hypothetical protein LJK87_34800 [Paenibacillus sp. P25]|nr:hypothetical protein LJK87_34800 [Paenibacillus sp. P25]